METVFSSAAKERKKSSEEKNDDIIAEVNLNELKEKSDKIKPSVFDDDEHGLHRNHKVDTSLLIYFFGSKGQEQVSFFLP